MGLTVVLYGCLAVVGGLMRARRLQRETVPSLSDAGDGFLVWRRVHVSLGIVLTLTVLLLLSIGIVGTLGHFGSLGHSPHLPVGLTVVTLTLTSAWSATQINHPNKPWARSLHITLNALLAISLALVSWTGWTVVQKYL
jgi:uncharacterized iron-regulated membrane protein